MTSTVKTPRATGKTMPAANSGSATTRRSRQLALLIPFQLSTGLANLAAKRLRHHPALSLLALIGVILAVGLVTSAGFFAQAVDQVILRREMAEYSRVTKRAPFATRIYTASSRQVPLTFSRAEQLGQNVAGTLVAEIGLPIKNIWLLFDSGIMEMQPLPGDTKYGDKRSIAKLHLLHAEEIAEYVTIIEGAPFEDGSSSEAISVWIPTAAAEEMGLHIGERFMLETSRSEAPFLIELAGFWQATDPDSYYWFSNPDQTLGDRLLIRRQDFIDQIDPRLSTQGRTATWQVIFDEQAVLPANARDYVTGFERGEAIITKYLPDARITAPSISLGKFVHRQTTLTTLLLGFNIPAFGFLLYFLILTSAVIAYWQRRETAVLVSRGMSVGSVLNFTLFEELILFVIGCPIGLLFGVVIARFMGNTESFLSFIERTPLPISWHGINISLTLFTLVVVLIARLLPAAQAARQTVLEQERTHARPMRSPFWYRNFLDLLLLIPTVYAYRQLSNRGTLAVLVQDRPEDLFQDPLLILVPAMFILTGALLIMRLFPLSMWLLDRLARLAPSTTLYLTLRQLGRQGHSYINSLLLVIVSLALGVYTLSMAASLDQWLIDRLYYSAGADLTFEPYLESLALAEDPASNPVGGDWIPPKDEFSALPNVESATRVGDYRAEIKLGTGGRVDVRFLALDRLDFPQVAWFRGDFAAESLGSLMNRLALSPDSILVSQSFLEENHLLVGDQIQLEVLVDFRSSVEATFQIAGTYQHFPTVYEDTEAVIGNLEYLFSFYGITMPHDIWLRTTADTDGKVVLEQVTTTGIDTINAKDTKGLITAEQAKMERVGVFGTLSVSFLAAAVMAALGLLTYSYASLQERLYHFALLNAIGHRRSHIVSQVFLEYALLTLYGAVGGVFVGSLAAELFIPLFRITGEQNVPLPPLIPIIVQEEIIPLALIFAGIMIALELLMIGASLYRRLFGMLRLGHQG